MCGAALVAWGCASAERGAAPAPTPSAPSLAEAGPAAAASAPRTAEIERLEVGTVPPGARIEIVSDSTLLWTTYRDGNGDLVVELPNARPGHGVVNRLYSEGLVAGVRVASAGVPSRPLTRFVISTREPTEHRLDAQGKRLLLDLVPSGMDFPSAAPAPLAVAAAPSPVAPAPVEPAPAVALEPVEPLAPAVAAESAIAAEEMPEVAAAAPPAHVAPAGGTPEQPHAGPPPSGEIATALAAVERLEPGSVRISGDGEFAYSTFVLENPERFVIDLEGVVNRSNRGTLNVDEGAVSKVRVSQFRVAALAGRPCGLRSALAGGALDRARRCRSGGALRHGERLTGDRRRLRHAAGRPARRAGTGAQARADAGGRGGGERRRSVRSGRRARATDRGGGVRGAGHAHGRLARPRRAAADSGGRRRSDRRRRPQGVHRRADQHEP
jgi:hypothetical protein